MYNSLQPHGLQHTRPPCPSPIPGACSNLCPSSRWRHPTSSSSVPSSSPAFNLPKIRVFFNESDLHIRWPNYWSFSFSISPPKEYSGLISFTIDWLDLLAVQGTLKSPQIPQFFGGESILWLSALFIVRLSQPYMTTGKTMALSRRTFVSKVMSLLFNMLSRLIIGFLPRSKCLYIRGCRHHLQWFWSPRK